MLAFLTERMEPGLEYLVMEITVVGQQHCSISTTFPEFRLQQTCNSDSKFGLIAVAHRDQDGSWMNFL